MYMPPNNGGDFTPPPAGSHLAICYRVVDLGTQQVEWQGQVKHQHKIMLSWELPDEKMEDGQPFTIHQRYTFSSSEKAILRNHLEAWRGKVFTEAELAGPPNGFDIKNVIGVPCFLTVVHEAKNGKTYANIKAIMKLPKGTAAPALTNPKVYFDLSNFDQQTFADLSEGLKTVIMKSPEYQEIVAKRNGPPAEQRASDANHNDLDDDIPF